MSTSRRQFLLRSAGVAATAGLPGSLLLATTALAATDETDALVNLIGLEQASALMYTTIGEKSSLSPATKKLINAFHDQEEAHVNAFSEALKQLGEDAPQTPTNVADINELKGLGQAKSEKDLLGFAIALEQKLVAAYLAATSDFETGDVIRSGSQVAADHMQHLVALRIANQVPASRAIVLPQPKAASPPPSSDNPSSTDSTSTDSTSTDSSTGDSTAAN